MKKTKEVAKTIIEVAVVIVVLPFLWNGVKQYLVRKTGWVLINTLEPEQIESKFETDSACIQYLKIHENRKGDDPYICGKGCVYDPERQKFLCDKYCGELFCSSKK